MTTESLSATAAMDAIANLGFDDGDDAAPASPEKKQPPVAAKTKTPPVATPEPDDEADASDEDDTEIETDADASTASEDDADGEETPTEGDEDAEPAKPAEPAIEPPAFLDATRRETFKALPRDAQQMLLDHDKAMQADYTRKTQETAGLRKALDQRLQAIKPVLTEHQAKLAEWAKVDWIALAQKVPAEEYNAYRAQHEADVQAHNELVATSSREEAKDLQEHDQAQVSKLKELAPHLLEGETGAQRRSQLVKHAIDAYRADGVDEDSINHRVRRITAFELAALDKAQKWDDHQAALKNKQPPKLTPKQDAKSTGKTIRPAARQAPSNQANGAIKSFRKAPTQANAMRALEDFD